MQYILHLDDSKVKMNASFSSSQAIPTPVRDALKHSRGDRSRRVKTRMQSNEGGEVARQRTSRAFKLHAVFLSMERRKNERSNCFSGI